jgi:quercetin dioxygenase-like cupin family protein
MISRNYKTEAVMENPHKLDVRQLYSEEEAQIMHITLKPGESLKPHKTPVNAIFYVLDGVATVHIGEESQSFERDTLIESPAEITHYISNNGEQNARILVIKAPRQANPTRLL